METTYVTFQKNVNIQFNTHTVSIPYNKLESALKDCNHITINCLSVYFNKRVKILSKIGFSIVEAIRHVDTSDELHTAIYVMKRT